MTSFLAKIFGGGKGGSNTPDPATAIQKLREMEEMLGKKQEFLEAKCEHELKVAKQHGTKNKRVALAALKRKKRYEKQLQQIDGTLTTIEFQREALENANTNTEVLSIMGEAANALKVAHKNMDVDNVHALMDDIQEQQEIANEISEAISNPVGFGTDVDEDDLLKELEDLEEEEASSKLLEIGPVAQDELPSVPNHDIPVPVDKRPSKMSEDEKAIRELSEWAS